MIHQGETVRFHGTLKFLEDCGIWKEVTDLSNFVIKARISNGDLDPIMYSSDQGTITIDTTKKAYAFELPGTITASMLGECEMEVALVLDGIVHVSDNLVHFVIEKSKLGQELNYKAE